MNNYSIEQESETLSSNTMLKVAGGGLLAGMIIASNVALSPIPTTISPPPLIHQSNGVELTSKTYGQYENAFTGAYEFPINFEKAITSFYTKLLEIQEPLGKEFEDVLNDNIWDLFIHT